MMYHITWQSLCSSESAHYWKINGKKKKPAPIYRSVCLWFIDMLILVICISKGHENSSGMGSDWDTELVNHSLHHICSLSKSPVVQWSSLPSCPISQNHLLVSCLTSREVKPNQIKELRMIMEGIKLGKTMLPDLLYITNAFLCDLIF